MADSMETRVWVWRFDHPVDRVWTILADIVLSHVIVDDPAVGDVLRGLDMEEEVALIRGVPDPVRFYRLTRTAIDAA